MHNEAHLARLAELQCLPHLLKNAGYVSLQTGKWWEGHYSGGGFTSGMTHGDPEKDGRHGDDGLVIGRQGLDVIFDFIREAEQNEDPFFVWYAPFLPHAPHTPPDSLESKYLKVAPTPAIAKYWAMCEWFDITCGQLLGFIEEQGMAENTLFIYVADNGWIQEPEKVNRYAPRSKRSPYDMGIRTPMIFNWRGSIEPRLDQEFLVSSIDIASSILGVCNIKPTENMQGINVLDRGQLMDREAVFAENYLHDFSSVDSSLLQKIVISGEWKLIVHDPLNSPGNPTELYKLFEDPHEWNNLAAENQDLVRELEGRLEAFTSFD